MDRKNSLMAQINGPELLRLVDSIARDRNIEKESLFTDIEQAMVSAARKHFDAAETDEITCELDRLSGAIKMWHNGETVSLAALGRIPAQTAKQVMIQRFREDERASIYDEYSQRIEELVTGTAQRYEGGALVVQVGRAEGFMPRSEQIPGEQHQPGERVRCLILDVRETASQVKIVLSRAHPDFIRRLFEVEVPEVQERIIDIKAMAREPGRRTKIAVASIDAKVDAVGACVGVRGSRIKNIVDELGGEKIDIVRWNESSQVLIQNALKPAEVDEISLCFELGRATVVVGEDQLSLAIGKHGQNVRLAARLTNWDIDILTPPEFAKSLEIMHETLREVEGIVDEQIDRLAALGVISIFDVEEVGVEYLAESVGIDPELADRVVAHASERAREVAEQQQREKEEAEKQRALEAAQPGAAQAAAILGDMASAKADPEAEGRPTAEGEGGDIVSMLESSRQGAGDASAGTVAGAENPVQDDGAVVDAGALAEQAGSAGDEADSGDEDQRESEPSGEDASETGALADRPADGR